MKRYLLLGLAIICLIAGCEKKTTTNNSNVEIEEQTSKEDSTNTLDLITSQKEFNELSDQSEIVLESYIQDKYQLVNNTTSLFVQGESGGYYIENIECNKDTYQSLELGQKILVKGMKEVNHKEVKIVNATIEVIEGNHLEEYKDMTNLLSLPELIDYQNQKAILKGLVIEESGIAQAYTYNWDDSGSDGDDLYFLATKDNIIYQFIVEASLCDENSEVYHTVKELNIGDVVDIECYLKWDEYFNPYVTSIVIQ